LIVLDDINEPNFAYLALVVSENAIDIRSKDRRSRSMTKTDVK
jgi:hypothetical protein